MQEDLKLSVNNVYHNDWVIFDGENHQIHSTCPEFPFLKDAKFGLGAVRWENIQPIPLTPEIMKRIEGIEYNPLENESLKQYMLEEKMFFIRNNNIVDYDSSLTILYLHTLQQLIRLFTNKEIKIKL